MIESTLLEEGVFHSLCVKSLMISKFSGVKTFLFLGAINKKTLSFFVYVFSKVSNATKLGSSLEKKILLSGLWAKAGQENLLCQI